MSKRIPNYSQNEMIALWQQFAKASFPATRWKVSFNGKKRAVLSSGADFVVLDEYHGDLEVLRPSGAKKGKPTVTHAGSYEIEVTYTPTSPKGKERPRCTGMKLGKFKSGGSKHEYELE